MNIINQIDRIFDVFEYNNNIYYTIKWTWYHKTLTNRLMSLLVFVMYCLGYRGKGIPFILPTLYHFGHKIFHLYNPIAHPINHRIWDGWIVLSGIMTIAFSLYVYCFRTMCFTNLFFDIVSKEYKAATKRLKKETHQHLFHLSIVSGSYSYFVAINRWSRFVGAFYI